ncbi:hypothetical protein CEXT_492771 [Caerostris extrusa]|uniref:Uncharacterized protein n=1 Tax=Caerostris extrusa TaxID=172846 RepID=A0AAV4RZ86_CAEEX|nr:hypothetical protein CEXT_492771 [Caerostris extrusa]
MYLFSTAISKYRGIKLAERLLQCSKSSRQWMSNDASTTPRGSRVLYFLQKRCVRFAIYSSGMFVQSFNLVFSEDNVPRLMLLIKSGGLCTTEFKSLFDPRAIDRTDC